MSRYVESDRGDNGVDVNPTLRRRLMEAEETLAAIQAGEVDAVVVEGRSGQQVYTLHGPDEPFRVFVETMQEGALSVDADGIVVYSNPFFARLVGQPPEQICGRPLESFIAADHRPSLRRMLSAAQADVVRGESHLSTVEEAVVPVQLAINRLPSEQVRMFGIVVTDLTERARADRLDAERRAAEDAKSARDHFLAVVSHELRTPLSAILGWAQALRLQPELPAAVRQGLDVIERNARAQSLLVEDLLDVSRILAGKLRLDLKPTDLAAVIRSAVDSARPSAESKRLVIEAELPASPIAVLGDADRLEQVVVNLLSNAIKYSLDGASVKIGLEATDAMAQITVDDCGVGINPELLPGLFELYHQIESDTTLHSGGLGLGLAIVRQLVELHGGAVTAESAGEGSGARFVTRLPLLDESLDTIQ